MNATSTPPARPAAVCAWLVLVSVALARPAAAEEPKLPDDLRRIRDGAAPLGDNERYAVELALYETGLTVDPAPDGKVVGEIHVVNHEVFSKRDSFFQFFNVFHIVTKEEIIEREVLLRPGDTWDPEVVRETERNLRDPGVTTLVVVLPVRSPHDGTVDLLVVTRDVWSLRTNSTFEIQNGILTLLDLRPAENNFLGRRKQLGAILQLDQGKFGIGPRYTDPNMFGKRLRLAIFGGPVFTRRSFDHEGSRHAFELGMPLYSLDREWGWFVRSGHEISIDRDFVEDELATYDAPETAAVETVPREFRRRDGSASIEATRSFGDELKHNLTFGHRLTIQRPGVTNSFVGDGVVRDAFVRDVLPRSERASALVLRYDFFQADFVEYRDIDTFDLPEDRQVGPYLTAEMATALEYLGSERNFVALALAPSWTLDVDGKGFVRASLALSTRLDSDGASDNSVDATFKVVTPPLWNAMRIVTRLRYARRIDDQQNVIFVLGGDTGLRGYQIGEFRGRVLAVANAEIRSMPLPLWSFEFGAVLFYDAGHAAEAPETIDFKHNVGIGLRMLMPQSGDDLWRLDWAIPLEPGRTPDGTKAGFPGRFTLGFGQTF